MGDDFSSLSVTERLAFTLPNGHIRIRRGTIAMSSNGEASEVIAYVRRRGTGEVRACQFDEALASLPDPELSTWINFLRPEEAHLRDVVAAQGFHELAVEDVFSPQSRAKIEEYGGHLFCVVPALNLNPDSDVLDIINLNAFLGGDYLITAQRAPLTAVAQVRELMERGEPPLLYGPDFVFYELLDALIDEYLPISDQVADSIDELDQRIFARFDPTVSEAIFTLKRRVAWLRRRVGPQRGIINTLTNRPHELIQPNTQIYLRDVHDHIFRISDNLETFHDLLQGALEAYMTQVTHRTNEATKLLSIVATIILPLNVLTGLYGTNFVHLPGSEGPISFWVFCGVLALVAVGATLLFRFRRWL